MKSRSNVFLLGFVLTICMVIINSSAHFNFRNRPRSTRGFKNAALSTARGFGKRDGSNADALIDIIADSKKDFRTDIVRSYPKSEKGTFDWFVEEIVRDPRLTEFIKNLLAEKTKGDQSSFEIYQSHEY